MKPFAIHLVALLLVLAAACIPRPVERPEPTPEAIPERPFEPLSPIEEQALPGAVAALLIEDGNRIGTVTFFDPRPGTLPTGIEVLIEASGLTPGFHGLHIHATGECDPTFDAAGGHFDPEARDHPHHRGDMPALLVTGDGSARLRFLTDRFTLLDLVPPEGQRAVVVHAEPDNFANIPARYAERPDRQTLDTGDSGAMVACGVIEAAERIITPPPRRPPAAKAELLDQTGRSMGEVQFALFDGTGKIEVSATVFGLSPGFHGFHIHETGRCRPTFAEAGGHYDPGDLSHPDHAGDMPSLLVGQDGRGELRFVTDRISIEEGNDGGILGGEGTAVLVHSDPDNFAHIPERYAEELDQMTLDTGDAGGRLACGVVTPAEDDAAEGKE